MLNYNLLCNYGSSYTIRLLHNEVKDMLDNLNNTS